MDVGIAERRSEQREDECVSIHNRAGINRPVSWQLTYVDADKIHAQSAIFPLLDFTADFAVSIPQNTQPF